MKKYLIIILIIILTIGIVGITNYKINNSKQFDMPEDFEPLIGEITKNTKLIDINEDHNQALDVSEYAVKNGIEIPKILINFDTHSDVYLNVPTLKFKSARVENWINEYLAKNPNVEELYWVMPDDEAHNLSLQTLFAENDFLAIKNSTPLYGNSLNTDIRWLHFVFTPLDKKPYTQEFLIDSKTGLINEISRIPEVNEKTFSPDIKYKKIKITTCTQKTLPNFDGKQVFLSIDADYTSNSGFDTVENFKIVKNENEISKTFYDIFNTIKSKNIQASIISLSLSPQYLPRKHHKFVYELFEKIIKSSGKKDEINTYTRRYEFGPEFIELDED